MSWWYNPTKHDSSMTGLKPLISVMRIRIVWKNAKQTFFLYSLLHPASTDIVAATFQWIFWVENVEDFSSVWERFKKQKKNCEIWLFKFL